MAVQPYLIHANCLLGTQGGSVILSEILSDSATKGGLSIH